MKFWKFTFTFIIFSILSFGSISVSHAIEIPSNYAVNALPINNTVSYEILKSNGIIYGWGDFAGSYVIEVGGTIEFSFLNFHQTWMGTVPFFNLTFRYANNQINATIANISNIDAAFLFTLNIGNFIPGLICPIDWNTNNRLAITQANIPSDDPYSPNGTLSIRKNVGTISYIYHQNPNNGNQNSTLTYSKYTGVIYSWNSEFFGYHLSVQLQETNTPFEIASFPPSILTLFGLFSVIVLINQNRKK